GCPHRLVGLRPLIICRGRFSLDLAGEAGQVLGLRPLKRVAFNRIHATRFSSLFSCMSLSQNRCTLLGDMH
ncbi:MAG TPA: hypothetical protein VD840_10730, partial [Sinorhizobium sp.]|nr:hypothetical protein [Sinorhizobium sp.]